MNQPDMQHIQTQLALVGERVGQVLSFDIYHDGTPIASKGHTITDALVHKLSQLEPSKLRFSREGMGQAVATDEYQRLLDEQIGTGAAELVYDAGVAEDLSEEVRAMATRKVKEIFESCRYLTKLDLSSTAELAADLIRRAASLDSAAFKLRDLRTYDEYTYFHSVNVCVLAVTIFRDFAENEQELLDVGIGMLLHDIGKSKIDLKILNKSGRLSEDEYAVMRRHVVYGYNLVKTNREMPEVGKNIILNHHERLNGTGYTRGLTEAQLGVFDMVAAICDVFDAATTNRVYRSKLDVHRAVSILIRGSGHQFQSKILNHFLRGIGRFPVGTFVLLSNGEIGVVSRVNSDALSLPVIRVIFDHAGGKLIEPRTVDLYHDQGLYIERPLDTVTPPPELLLLGHEAVL